ncbi:MAG: restriction endonuclease [Chloroflexota bacterium]|nr:restriction endonuclease [Chloroflexota bacterium]
MAVWVIRAGAQGQGEEFAIERGIASIDFGFRRDLADFADQSALRDQLTSTMAASQLWRFAHEIKDGDMIVLPRKQPKVIAVGKITGDYAYRPDMEGAHGPHTRPVEWEATDIPRANFDQDLLHSLGGLATVFQPRAEDAETRIAQVSQAHLAGAPVSDTISDPDEPPEPAVEVDMDEYVLDFIAQCIRRKFSGTRLEYLVAKILEAEGYTTLQTRQGPDGGVDVMAGGGRLGFGEPRLCVQVKSGRLPIDLSDYNRLQASVRNFGADHGLLVSLGDFTRSVRNENERSFFEIRLWGSGELAQRVRESYDSLPVDVQMDIPLERGLLPRRTEGWLN